MAHSLDIKMDERILAGVSIPDNLPTQLATVLGRLANVEDADVHQLITHVVQSLQEGHVCLTLTASMVSLLQQHADHLAGLIGGPKQFTPLILEGTQLYLHRYWFYENALATQLQQRLQQAKRSVDEERLMAGLALLFPPTTTGVDWQKVAATAACLSGFSIISGGPGTGKTSTVLRLLLLLGFIATHPLRIRLAAPTGKAAARMAEGIRNAIQKLPAEIQASFAGAIAAMPPNAETLHRLLGPKGNGFTHHALHPLSLDVLVIDEASMIDQAMMYHLFEAVPPNATVILLGDKNQLSSVEAGSVFADLCSVSTRTPAMARQLSRLTGFALESTEAPAATTPAPSTQLDMFTRQELEDTLLPPRLSDQVHTLHHSYRFAGVPGIGALANLILSQAGGQLHTVIAAHDSLHWHDQPQHANMLDQLAIGFEPYFRAVKLHAADTPASLLACFDQFRVLTALKEGIWGANGINRALERRFQLKRWIQLQAATGQTVYKGLALMITENDYQTGLFNGDVGIVLPDTTGALQAWFPALDQSWRTFSISRLPNWLPAWAMTVHKSQGSEFDHAAIVLPDTVSPILTRALLYTAVTRAKQRVSMWGKPEIMKYCLYNHPKRMSGLIARLR